MESLSESINWPPEFSELKKLDVILKCGICYEFMNNCMITSCSHTYCSLCIRKFMQYKNQCPTCFGETYEINLRNNRLLDEVINIYTKIREKLLRASRLASITIPQKNELKEKASDKEVTESVTSQTKITSELFDSLDNEETIKITQHTKIKGESLNVNLAESKQKKIDPFDDDSIMINGVKVPGMFTSPKILSIRPKKPEELANCPVCEVQVPARNINIHLDSCLALDLKTKPKVRKRSPLPKRVYTMMPEKNLKKFLKEYGLSTSGDRKAMTSRLQRYTVIYNAENDAVNPRPVSELVKQLEREEKEEKKPNSLIKNLQSASRTSTTSAASSNPATKKDADAIEKANKAYREENKASFKKLIEQMCSREGRNIKPLKPTNRIYSDDEDFIKESTPDLNDLPTTSGVSNCIKFSPPQQVHYSRRNDSVISDSDGEIFIESENEDEQLVKGKIDWNKTSKNDNDIPSSESIYDAPTQKPLEEDEQNKCEILPEEEIEANDESLKESTPVDEEVKNTSTTESSDSDSSVFETSIDKNVSVYKPSTAKRDSRSVGCKLSLSWKKRFNDNQVEEDFNGFPESISESKNGSSNVVSELEYSSPEDSLDHTLTDQLTSKMTTRLTRSAKRKSACDLEKKTDGFTESISESKNGSSNVVREFSSSEDSLDHALTDQLTSKMTTRLTRSAKRKSTCDLEKKTNDENEAPTTPVSTRKKSKRDLSPSF